MRWGRQGWSVVAGIVTVGVCAAVVVGWPSDDEGAGGDTLQAGEETTTTEAPTQAEVALARRTAAGAARALETAGSFGYDGVVRSAGASAAWPGATAGEEIAVSGGVALPGRSIDRSSGDGVVSETIVSGRGVWQRSAAAEADLTAVPWALAAEADGPIGLAALPTWLAQTVDRVPAGRTDVDGLTVSGTVTDGAPDELGAAVAALAGGRIDVTVDDAGVPTQVSVRVPADAPVLEIDITIRDLGVPVEVGPPGGRELGVTPPFGPDELAAHGFAEPVQLTELPPGWFLAEAQIESLGTDDVCRQLALAYANVVDARASLGIEVTNEHCPVHHGQLVQPQRLGSGWRADVATYHDASGSFVDATNGTTRVHVFSTLGPDDVVPLVVALGPFDPLSQPSLTAGPALPVLGGPVT